MMRMWSYARVMQCDSEYIRTDYKALREFVRSWRSESSTIIRPKFRLLLARKVPDRYVIRFTDGDCEAEEDIEFVLDMLYTSVVPPTT